MLANNYTDDWLNYSIKLTEQFHYIQEDSFAIYHRSLFMNEDVTLLSEGLKDTLRNFWKALKQKLKELWDKFKMMVDRLVKSNKAWLEKYKSTILNAKLDNFEYEISPYWDGSNRIQQTKVPDFNEMNSKLMDSLKDEQTFRDTWFRGLGKVDGEDNFVSGLKDHFRGGDKATVKGNVIKSKLPGMIDFCMKYDSIVKVLDRDYNNIQKSADKALLNANKVINTTDSTEPRTQMKDEPEKAEEPKPTGDEKTKSEGFSFEELLMLTEDQIDKEVAKKSVGANTNKYKENINNKTSKPDSNSGGTVDNSTNEKAQQNADKYRLYVSFCQKVLGAKQTVFEERYREYMKLFRNLVSGNAKGEGTSSNQDKKNAENRKVLYANLSKEQKKKVDKLQNKREDIFEVLVNLAKGKLPEKYQANKEYQRYKAELEKADKDIDEFYKAR